MTTTKITKGIVITIILLFSVLRSVAQYTYPEGSRMELLGKSEKFAMSTLFRNELGNVFLFTDDNVICSVAGSTDSLPFVVRVAEAGDCKNAFFAGKNFIVDRPKEIVALSQDMNNISQMVREEKLYKYGKRDIKAFFSNSEGFFIVEHKTDKKSKSIFSQLSYFDLTNNKVKPILEVDGNINCVSGDTAVMCLGIDSNLVIISNRQVVVAATEKEEIITVAPSVAGIFYSTSASTYFISENLLKITIADQGAIQLIDNCNTLYMILEDGSLLRLLNTLAFKQYNKESENGQDGDK